MPPSYGLLVESQVAPSRTLEFSQPRVLVGREQGDVLLSDTQISNPHAELLFDGQALVLRDLNSTNGTWSQGQRITALELAPGSSVQLGQHRITFLGLSGAATGRGRTVAVQRAPTDWQASPIAPAYPAQPTTAPYAAPSPAALAAQPTQANARGYPAAPPAALAPQPMQPSTAGYAAPPAATYPGQQPTAPAYPAPAHPMGQPAQGWIQQPAASPTVAGLQGYAADLPQGAPVYAAPPPQGAPGYPIAVGRPMAYPNPGALPKKRSAVGTVLLTIVGVVVVGFVGLLGLGWYLTDRDAKASAAASASHLAWVGSSAPTPSDALQSAQPSSTAGATTGSAAFTEITFGSRTYRMTTVIVSVGKDVSRGKRVIEIHSAPSRAALHRSEERLSIGVRADQPGSYGVGSSLAVISFSLNEDEHYLAKPGATLTIERLDPNGEIQGTFSGEFEYETPNGSQKTVTGKGAFRASFR